MSKWCQIEGCYNAANSVTNGIRTCERCRLGFVSLGMGAVYFADRWHGVSGAHYTAEQEASHPGIIERVAHGDPRSGPWAREAREGR